MECVCTGAALIELLVVRSEVLVWRETEIASTRRPMWVRRELLQSAYTGGEGDSGSFRMQVLAGAKEAQQVIFSRMRRVSGRREAAWKRR